MAIQITNTETIHDDAGNVLTFTYAIDTETGAFHVTWDRLGRKTQTRIVPAGIDQAGIVFGIVGAVEYDFLNPIDYSEEAFTVESGGKGI